MKPGPRMISPLRSIFSLLIVSISSQKQNHRGKLEAEDGEKDDEEEKDGGRRETSSQTTFPSKEKLPPAGSLISFLFLSSLASPPTLLFQGGGRGEGAGDDGIRAVVMMNRMIKNPKFITRRRGEGVEKTR